MGEGGRISWGRLILGGVLALGIASVLMVLIGPLIAVSLTGGSHFQIHDDSMAPALIAGDWVLAEELRPGELPERGAIVVYIEPKSGAQQESIMRLIALPGERVQMRGGALYIDGQRAGMELVSERVVTKRPPDRRAPLPLCLNDPVPIDGDCRQEIWRETLPDGTAQRIVNSQNKLGVAKLAGGDSPDDTTLFTVPRDHVFVLGDNRDHAVDSRYRRHGMVPVENLRYRVWMVHTSLDRSARFLQPRWGRFFRKVD